MHDCIFCTTEFHPLFLLLSFRSFTSSCVISKFSFILTMPFSFVSSACFYFISKDLNGKKIKQEESHDWSPRSSTNKYPIARQFFFQHCLLAFPFVAASSVGVALSGPFYFSSEGKLQLSLSLCPSHPIISFWSCC